MIQFDARMPYALNWSTMRSKQNNFCRNIRFFRLSYCIKEKGTIL